MSRSTNLRRTALLSALTAFAIPEMHAEPGHRVNQMHQPEQQTMQAVGLGHPTVRTMRLEPTQRWVF